MKGVSPGSGCLSRCSTIIATSGRLQISRPIGSRAWQLNSFSSSHVANLQVQMPRYSDFQSWLGGLIEILVQPACLGLDVTRLLLQVFATVCFPILSLQGRRCDNNWQLQIVIKHNQTSIVIHCTNRRHEVIDRVLD